MYKEAIEQFMKGQKIVIISHFKPDADTVGAATALAMAYEQLGRECQLACIDPIPENYNFIEKHDNYIKEFNYKDFDLVLVVDAGAHYMTKYHDKYPGIFSGDEVPVLNIDHHVSNDFFGTTNLVDTEKASATLIIYEMFKQIPEIEITPEMATSLLAGIYNDTGSFKHTNTNEHVLKVSGDLVSKGAKFSIIAKNMFQTTPLKKLKLWGKAMENIQLNENNVTMSVLTNSEIASTGSSAKDLSGLIDYINVVPDSKYTVLLNEDQKGNVKGSLRTNRDDIDVDQIAKNFGGGGHKKAAGFTVPGRIEKEVKFKLITEE